MQQNDLNSAKSIAALSWWWAATPLFTMFCMISRLTFIQNSNLFDEFNLFFEAHVLQTYLLFLVLPLAGIVVNFPVIRSAWMNSSYPTRISFIQPAYANFLVMLLIKAIS